MIDQQKNNPGNILKLKYIDIINMNRKLLYLFVQ